MYYTACIEKVPHSGLAEQCFKAYEESITLGYSGSSGTHIPSAVRKHLNNLKEKARIQGDAKKGA
ncbi:MAG: hypothetical protein HC883_03500 [Bdellovibrionaceae bacterium]|nr:hypothetical protein [Pseudobdellovibrionaceae bacterium]